MNSIPISTLHSGIINDSCFLFRYSMRCSKNTCLNLKCWPCCLTHKNLNKSRLVRLLESAAYTRAINSLARKDLDTRSWSWPYLFLTGVLSTKSFFFFQKYVCHSSHYMHATWIYIPEKYLAYVLKNKRTNQRHRHSVTLCVQLKYYNLLVVTFLGEDIISCNKQELNKPRSQIQGECVIGFKILVQNFPSRFVVDWNSVLTKFLYSATTSLETLFSF